MKIIIGSDHAGFKLKQELIPFLKDLGNDVKDKGTHSEESVDYPLIAKAVAQEAAKNKQKAILICGTGIGMCISANKIKGIRAALAYDEDTARLSREHNDANILCIGGRKTAAEKAKKIIRAWLDAEPSQEPRHKKRVKEMMELE